MRKYGQPMRRENGSDTWEVANTSDGIRAAGRFTVLYDGNGKAVSAYTENY